MAMTLVEAYAFAVAAHVRGVPVGDRQLNEACQVLLAEAEKICRAHPQWSEWTTTVVFKVVRQRRVPADIPDTPGRVRAILRTALERRSIDESEKERRFAASVCYDVGADKAPIEALAVARAEHALHQAKLAEAEWSTEGEALLADLTDAFARLVEHAASLFKKPADAEAFRLAVTQLAAAVAQNGSVQKLALGELTVDGISAPNAAQKKARVDALNTRFTRARKRLLDTLQTDGWTAEERFQLTAYINARLRFYEVATDATLTL